MITNRDFYCIPGIHKLINIRKPSMSNINKYGTVRIAEDTWKDINKQLDKGVTHRDLKSLLEEVSSDESSAFKVNIGFGSIIYETVNEIYRYFYVFSNHLLLDKAFTISTNRHMADFIEAIISLDLANNHYLKRHSPGWVLAGLPNVEILVYRLRGIPIGEGVQLPEYVKKFHHRFNT